MNNIINLQEYKEENIQYEVAGVIHARGEWGGQWIILFGGAFKKFLY